MQQAENGDGEYKQVVISTIKGPVARIPIDDVMKENADYWCKRLDNRKLLNESDRISMREVAQETMDEFQVDPAAVRAMAISGVVQVSIPFDETDLALDSSEPCTIDHALLMPWEYVISAATKKYRNNNPLCVVRHVDGNRITQDYRKSRRQNRKLRKGQKDLGGYCYVETAPGEMAGFYDFSLEKELVEGAFGALRHIELPVNPSIDELEETAASFSPDVLHFTGIDSRLGRKLKKQLACENAKEPCDESPSTKCSDSNRLAAAAVAPPINVASDSAAEGNGEVAVALPTSAQPTTRKKLPVGQTQKEAPVGDGLYFSYQNLDDFVDYKTIAKAVTAGERKPQLIGFNCHYSGARLAAASVVHGAREAIGIQNTLDDDLAERFFIRFYQYWNSTHVNDLGEKTDQDSLAAFIAAWDFIKPMGESIKGTGIILWSNTSVFSRRKGQMTPNLKGVQTVKDQIASDRKQHDDSQVVADPGKYHIKELVSVTVETLDVITPCMLHYGDSILDKLYFLFKNLTPDDDFPVQCVKGIDVEVTLTVGQESYPYRTRVSLGVDHPNLELTNRDLVKTEENPSGGIQVPLTSGLIKSADDNVRGNLFVNIEWEGQILHRHTYSVKIAPINEWRLNEKDSLLQPMFVQPRDNAVKKIISCAEKYLRCITQDTTSSFCGYQAEDIEPQLKAIWAALVLDFSIGYVSPPPSYNVGTQRLRTPADVLEEGRGTCVDLALLLASCMEWIELYPVIINTAHHAFVGCWRYADADGEYSDDDFQWTVDCYQTYHKKLKEGQHGTKNDGYQWVFPADKYSVFFDLIHFKSIIPLEATCLTENKMYLEAKNYAINYFGEDGICDQEIAPGPFESVTDVRLARQYLQPLPMARR